MKRGIDRLKTAGATFIDIDKTPKASVETNLTMSARWRCCWQLGISVALGTGSAIAINSEYALAQSNIVPDGTLGAESSIVIPNSGGGPVEEIGGGAIRGANLFHSFQEFNVSEGRGAYFFSPAATIQNILARVTGNNPSQILGTLGTFGNSNPNLFLINPNGIIFGPNANLNVGGSFVASTANAVTFPNRIEFSASNPQAPPLLTISVPLGLQYGRNPANVSVQGSFLQVPNGQTLALVGGGISLDGAFLQTLGGRVELGAVAEESTVELNGDGANLSLSFPQGMSLTDISLTNGTEVFVRAGGGGSIAINAQNVSMAGGSAFYTGLDSGLGSSSAIAGNVEINATGAINLTNGSRITSFVLEGARGQGGDVNISTGQLRVFDGSLVVTGTYGEGNGGNVTVNASQGVQLIGESTNGQFASGLFALVEQGSSGKAGDITINTGLLLARDGAKVNANTLGEGDGGNLTVNAFQGVQLVGTSADGQYSSGLFVSSERGASGKAGDAIINTGSLLVRDGAAVNASTYGEGDGGNLIVNASQAVQLIGESTNGEFASGLFALVEQGSSGKAGDVTINTGTLLVRDGAKVNASTFGEENGGKLTVNASSGVELIGTSADGQFSSGLFVSSARGATGKAGDVIINTGTLLVQDGAVVNAATFSEGDAGSLTVNASSGVELIGTSADGQFSSGLFVQAREGSKGEAGNLTINTSTLLVRDGAAVSASTFGEGDGGNLTVNASQSVQVIGTSVHSQLSSGLYAQARPESSGKAGNLTIYTGTLLVQDGAEVAARTFSSGNGGSLAVNASDSVQLSGAGSGLLVNATAGSTAGNLTVETGKMSVQDGAQVTVSSPQGQAGNLSITANSLTLNRGTLSAVTGTSGAEGGANITLSGLDFLRMDNESLISASALGNANGGNVTIDSTLIVATPPTGSEGSDIIANADQGNGGRVNITTQGLFGIQFRPRRTPKNDITVSSTFGLSGEYVLNTPGVDPSRGLAQLPTNVVDASQQIDRRCTPDAAKERGSFTITGRGGLPPNPNEPLQGESVITNWVTLDSEENNNTPPASTTPKSSAPRELVEAQGWIINEKGQVVLLATAPNATPQGTWLSPPECNPSQSSSRISEF